jgi:hypothetical protein
MHFSKHQPIPQKKEANIRARDRQTKNQSHGVDRRKLIADGRISDGRNDTARKKETNASQCREWKSEVKSANEREKTKKN